MNSNKNTTPIIMPIRMSNMNILLFNAHTSYSNVWFCWKYDTIIGVSFPLGFTITMCVPIQNVPIHEEIYHHTILINTPPHYAQLSDDFIFAAVLTIAIWSISLSSVPGSTGLIVLRPPHALPSHVLHNSSLSTSLSENTPTDSILKLTDTGSFAFIIMANKRCD